MDSDSDNEIYDWEEILSDCDVEIVSDPIIYICIFCKKEFNEELVCKNHQKNCKTEKE